MVYKKRCEVVGGLRPALVEMGWTKVLDWVAEAAGLLVMDRVKVCKGG